MFVCESLLYFGGGDSSVVGSKSREGEEVPKAPTLAPHDFDLRKVGNL